MKRKLGVPVAALIAGGIVIAALTGGLVASSLSDDGEDEGVVVTSVAPAANAGPEYDDDQIEPATEPDAMPLRGAEAKRVAAAAIEAAGGGTVIEAERSDDPGEAYEVEVMTDAGEVDIALDENLKRVSNSSAYDD